MIPWGLLAMILVVGVADGAFVLTAIAVVESIGGATALAYAVLPILVLALAIAAGLSNLIAKMTEPYL